VPPLSPLQDTSTRRLTLPLYSNSLSKVNPNQLPGLALRVWEFLEYTSVGVLPPKLATKLAASLVTLV
jgi:hypothetical protein